MCEQNIHKEGECHCKVERVPNFAQPRLLLELAIKPTHGYELIERLSEEGGSAPDPGNLYRVLRSLEEEGFVLSTWETPNSGAARRVYQLTENGLDFLHTWEITVQQTYQSLGRFLSDYQLLFPK
jgi:PadR family transcriptional regulator, regulatory protein PadR